ncbi:MAG: hypothetical protein Alis3KO_04200 [Aliiglaciecola sp.]
MSDLLQGHALVIGINEYRGTISSLQSAVKDASAISVALQEHHDYQVTCLLDEQASAEAIYEHIEKHLPQTLHEESAFLLYFAGHGVARGDGSEGPKGFLLPQDATPGEQESWVSMERIRKALEAYKNRHMLIILDCCFAGSFRWTSTRDVFIEEPLYESQYQRFLRGQAWQVLTSASHDEKAMDVAPGRDNTRDAEHFEGHSPFAAALLSGLSGEADSAQGSHQPDGVITATELYQYAFSELVPPDARSNQTPGIWPLRPDNEGQYIFRNPKHPKNTIPDPPLDDSNNPWLGLSSYNAENAALLFGREKVIDDIIEQLQTPESHDFIAVVGASGTGKSSVVKAGVLPKLQNAGWTIIRSNRLSEVPMVSLDAAMKEIHSNAKDGNTLLYIDQFEELYTLCTDATLQSEYLARLRQLIEDNNHFYIMITLRSDFEPRLASSESMGELWQNNRFLVPAFSSEDFRQCIEGPARVRALYFEDEALVAEIIEEVMAMPGALPLLSFALSEMYRSAQIRRRESGANDRALLREDYQRIGGVVGSLHGRASDLFDKADTLTQSTIKRVFLRMMSQDGARLARRRIQLKELQYSDPQEQKRVDKVLENYVNARLLVVDNDSIEPAHDTLVMAWTKLLEWLSESGPQVLLRSLWRSASDWQNSKQQKGLTWHDDPRLAQALSKINENELNSLEKSFVLASEKLRKSGRRRKYIISFVIVLALAIVGLIAYDKSVQADIKEQEAKLQTAENELLQKEAQFLEEEAAFQAEEATFHADQARLARETRDQVYLDILQRGNFFSLSDMLGTESQGGVVATDEQWRPLVTVPNEGTFVAARVYGEGRIMASGHENLLTYFDENGESIFLELALYWLMADLGNTVYFTHGHLETLPRYNPNGYQTIRDVLSRSEYDLSIENLPFEEAVANAAVVIIANAWTDFSEDEKAVIKAYVENGGGLLVAGLGWSWKTYGPHDFKDQNEAMPLYPMNKLMEDFGLIWTDQPFWSR